MRAVRVEVELRHKDESFERLLKRFIKKVKKERIIEESVERRYYEKPSLRRKKEARRKKKVLEKLRKKYEELYD